MARNSSKTYADFGYNRFLRRSLSSTQSDNSLSSMVRSNPTVNSINFDQVQVSGNIGDVLEVGKIKIDGSTGDGRIDGRDSNTNTVWRLGDQEG